MDTVRLGTYFAVYLIVENKNYEKKTSLMSYSYYFFNIKTPVPIEAALNCTRRITYRLILRHKSLRISCKRTRVCTILIIGRMTLFAAVCTRICDNTFNKSLIFVFLFRETDKFRHVCSRTMQF
jgi:hypothetical protein